MNDIENKNEIESASTNNDLDLAQEVLEEFENQEELMFDQEIANEEIQANLDSINSINEELIGDLDNVDQPEEILTTPVVEKEEISELFQDNEKLDEEKLELNEEEFELTLDEVKLDDNENNDLYWKARTGLNEETLCGAIETIVFMSDKPIALTKIKNLIDEEIPLRIIHESIVRLQDEYEAKHHGIRLMEVAEGYQFRTKATYSKYIGDLFKVSSLVLSPSTLEVMAVIAYKQPISRTYIDKMRGVDSSHLIRALMDKRLVKTAGRSNEAGRPVLYATTPEFLEVFNLAHIGELPPEFELESMAKSSVGSISDIKEIIESTDKDRFNFDESEELEELQTTIKSILADTDFTHTLRMEEKRRKTDDGEEKLSAFDLLEQFVSEKSVKTENEKSSLSEPMFLGDEPKVINDLTGGPYNIPEEEDDFQMLDAETGEEVEDSFASFDEEFEDLEDFDTDLTEQTDEMDSLSLSDDDISHNNDDEEELLFEDKGESIKDDIKALKEEDSLEAALDNAFAALEDLDFDKKVDEKLDLAEKNLDDMQKNAHIASKNLDLDLDFLDQD